MATLFSFTFQQLTGEELNMEANDAESYVVQSPESIRRVLELTNNKIKRGDVVHMIDFDYRNDGRVLWDGNKLIPMDSEIDDYGGVPKEFKVGDEFLANHWMEVLTRGRDHAWIDVSKHREELIANLTYIGTYFTTPLGQFHIKFSTHSLIACREKFLHLINNNNILCLIGETSHTILFRYSQDNEWKDILGYAGSQGYMDKMLLFTDRGSKYIVNIDEETGDNIITEII